jgi:hypothetical protein
MGYEYWSLQNLRRLKTWKYLVWRGRMPKILDEESLMGNIMFITKRNSSNLFVV